MLVIDAVLGDRVDSFILELGVFPAENIPSLLDLLRTMTDVAERANALDNSVQRDDGDFSSLECPPGEVNPYSATDDPPRGSDEASSRQGRAMESARRN